MQADIEAKRGALAEICRRYGVARLEVFGSVARGARFDPNRSDADFLVTFAPSARNDLAAFSDLKDALEKTSRALRRSCRARDDRNKP